MSTASPWVAVAAILVIATRQHALAILMHDAAHRTLLPSRRWNEIVAEALLAFPLLVSTELYRRHHLGHHRLLGTPDDPDANDNLGPTSRLGFLRYAMADISGLNLVRSFRTANSFTVLAAFGRKSGEPGSLPASRKIGFLVFWSIMLPLSVMTIGWLWVALLWFLPLMTLTQAMIRFGAYAEHGGCVHDHPLRSARTTLASPWSRFWLAPCNINYHLEHHLYPGVPNRRLAELNRRLMALDAYRREAHITRGYLLGPDSFVGEMCARPGAAAEALAPASR